MSEGPPFASHLSKKGRSRKKKARGKGILGRGNCWRKDYLLYQEKRGFWEAGRPFHGKGSKIAGLLSTGAESHEASRCFEIDK